MRGDQMISEQAVLTRLDNASGLIPWAGNNSASSPTNA
ncbi:hypothetical protein SPLC1_S300610 [Arthrospira platensis C1]|nr:hypothetical protein SPLC1_S300610 [Arthrospira platensis C1]